MVLVLKTSHWYRFHPFYMSVSPVLWHKCQRVFSWASCNLSTEACWELWLSDDQPHSDYYGQWQRALCMLAVLQSSQPNPQRNEKKGKIYAIKQIRICAEYRDMLPRPRLDLSGTPGLRPIGLSPGSWQTSLGLGSMSRYSAQILICIAWSLVVDLLSCEYQESSHWVVSIVSVLAWCRKASSQYPSQCCPRSMSPLAALGHSEIDNRPVS